jgi:hypothetical protein
MRRQGLFSCLSAVRPYLLVLRLLSQQQHQQRTVHEPAAAATAQMPLRS